MSNQLIEAPLAGINVAPTGTTQALAATRDPAGLADSLNRSIAGFHV